MFLKIQHDDDSSLLEILDLRALFDPFCAGVKGRIHGGEEIQDPETYEKSSLSFPSGEALPRCWVDPAYQDLRGVGVPN